MDTPKNSAFVFIKPHAVTEDVKSLVNERTSIASHHPLSLAFKHLHTCIRCPCCTTPHSKLSWTRHVHPLAECKGRLMYMMWLMISCIVDVEKSTRVRKTCIM